MTEPNAHPSAPSIWLWPRLGTVRSLASLLGAGVALAAFVRLLWGDLTWAWAEVGLLGLALPLMALDRVDAHAYVRAALWGALWVGAATSFSHGVSRFSGVGLTLFLGTAVSLLALGGKGLDARHGTFTPRVLRRTLLTMMVGALSVAHVLALTTAGVAEDAGVGTLGLLASPALLLAGVVGLSRTRAWGLFAYLGAVLLMGGTAAAVGWLDWGPAFDHGYISARHVIVALWTVAAGFSALVGLPVVAALVFKRRPGPEGRPWGTWLHSCAVLGVVGLVLSAIFG